MAGKMYGYGDEKKKSHNDKDMEDKKKAKLDVLGDLKKMMSGEMAKGLKKVTVASPTEEGLKKGLEKAEEIVDKGPKSLMDDTDYEKEDQDDKEESNDYMKDHMNDMEDMEMSTDEIDDMIAMLEEKKSKLQKL